MRSKSGDSTHLVAIPNHARALPQDDPRRRRAFNGGFIGRDGDLEIVVSWRLVKRAYAVVNYEQAVEPFLETDRLSDSERAMLMGGACAEAYRWSPKKG